MKTALASFAVMSLVVVASRAEAQAEKPAAQTAPSPFAADATTYAPRYGESSRPLKPGGPGTYVVPFYVIGDPRTAENTAAPSAVAAAETVGRLFLDVEPATAQVLVDGIAAGTVADFRGTGLLLTEGLRRIELRAPGYESATFDINVFAARPTRYRGDLLPVRKAAVEAPNSTRRGPDTFYVIPGCYAGNRPPRERTLPRGCDIARTRTIPS